MSRIVVVNDFRVSMVMVALGSFPVFTAPPSGEPDNGFR